MQLQWIPINILLQAGKGNFKVDNKLTTKQCSNKTTGNIEVKIPDGFDLIGHNKSYSPG